MHHWHQALGIQALSYQWTREEAEELMVIWLLKRCIISSLLVQFIALTLGNLISIDLRSLLSFLLKH